MKQIEAMERPYDWQMQQRRHVIQSDSHLSYGQIEMTCFLMLVFHESSHKSSIARI